MRTRSMLLVATLAVAACGSPASDPQAKPRLFSTQTDALTKAKGVSDTVLKADEARRAQEDNASK